MEGQRVLQAQVKMGNSLDHLSGWSSSGQCRQCSGQIHRPEWVEIIDGQGHRGCQAPLTVMGSSHHVKDWHLPLRSKVTLPEGVRVVWKWPCFGGTPTLQYILVPWSSKASKAVVHNLQVVTLAWVERPFYRGLLRASENRYSHSDS